MILVTGATGILGRVIVLELLKRGKSVRATKRKSSDLVEVRNSYKFYTENPDDFFDKIEWMDVDFDDLSSLQNALNGVEEVYHCAAKVSFNPKDKKELYRSNIEGTKQLLYACEGSSVKKFLFVSSVAVLDEFNEQGQLDEDSNYNPKLEHSSYAKSKHFSEMEVWRASAEGLNTVIINPGMILGSGNWNQSSGTLFKTFENSRYTFSGGSAYVDVRDVAKIAVELMEGNHFGERFLCISESKSYKEIGTPIRKKLGLSAMKIIPNGLLKLALPLRFLGFLIPPFKMINRPNIEAITTNSPMSNEKVKKTLNFEFIPISESLEFHLDNYCEERSGK